MNPVTETCLKRSSSKESRRKKEFVLDELADHIDGTDRHMIEWSRLDHTHALSYVETLLAKDLAPSTVGLRVAGMRAIAKEAWLVGQITGDEYQRILTVKPPRGSRVPKGRAVSEDERASLMDACENDDRAQALRDLAMMAIMAGGGLRRMEVVSLDVAHLKVRDQAVLVRGKGNKERLVPLPREAWDLLMLWIKHGLNNRQGPLFVRIRRNSNVTQDRLTPQAVYYILKQRQQMAGIDAIAPHDLRRTFGTILLDEGVDIATVADLMGHESIETTKIYDRRNETRKRAAIDRISLGFGRRSAKA